MQQIVDERTTQWKRVKMNQFLVHWKDNDETWEYEVDLLDDAPKFARTLIKKFRMARDKKKQNTK